MSIRAENSPPTSKSNEFIFLVVGRSGSGKTTIVNKLCDEHGYTAIESYTTRPPRTENERGHVFITEDEFPQPEEWVGYTEYNGYRYCATQDQVEKADFYVIDPAGVGYFMQKYHGDKTPVVIGIYASEARCRARMRERGDADEAIEVRITNDAQAFAHAVAHIWLYNDHVFPEAVGQVANIMQCTIENADLLKALASSQPHEYQYKSIVEVMD
nr:MAG TPA: Guanylate kinase [Caudoviricetes sp.]